MLSKKALSKTLITSTLLATPLAHAADGATDAELKQRVDELQRQVTQMKRALEDKERSGAKTSMGGTEIQVGGYVKLDSIVSDYSDGSRATAGIGEDFLVPSTIPVGGESGDRKFHAHAKSSRLFVKTHTATESGYVNTLFEFDAIGGTQGDERISNSYSERVRHAYVDWKVDAGNSLLAGQTWSTFFNVRALPEVLDFVGPVGTIFERQAQLRYTRTFSRSSFQIAAENPATTLYNGTTNPYDDNSAPDLIARFNGQVGFPGYGNIFYSVAAMARELRYEDGAADNDANGYGVSVAGRVLLYDYSGDIRFMLNYGSALGRYMGLNGFRAGIIEADGDIELIDQMGGFIALRHLWNDRWRSNLILSATRADNPDTVADDTPSDYESVHVNLLYSPVSNLTLGAEYIYANKTLENGSGALPDDEGELDRLQFSVKYVF